MTREHKIDGDTGKTLTALWHDAVNVGKSSTRVSFVRGFPIFLVVTGTMMRVNYMPYIHTSYIESALQECKVENPLAFETKLSLFSEEDDGEDGFVSYTPMPLFPATNYLRLASIVVDYLDVVKAVKTNASVGFLINGLPGLGKTKFADYIASKNIFRDVYKLDMTNFLEKSPDKLFNMFYHSTKPRGPSLFMIDEMDKYIDVYIRKSYEPKDALAKPVTKTREDHNKDVRTDFLYELLRIVEKERAQPTIVIFCCNNFDSLFRGVDMTHFKSLIERFIPYTFDQCDANETIRYLDHYNKALVGTPFECHNFAEVKDKLIKGMTIPITFRKLNHISLLARYKSSDIVDVICSRKEIEHTPEFDFSMRSTKGEDKWKTGGDFSEENKGEDKRDRGSSEEPLEKRSSKEASRQIIHQRSIQRMQDEHTGGDSQGGFTLKE